MTPSEQASQKRRQERQEMLADLNRQAELRRQQVKDLLNQCATDRDRDADKRRQMRREVLTRISDEVKEIVGPANTSRPAVASVESPNVAAKPAPTATPELTAKPELTATPAATATPVATAKPDLGIKPETKANAVPPAIAAVTAASKAPVTASVAAPVAAPAAAPSESMQTPSKTSTPTESSAKTVAGSPTALAYPAVANRSNSATPTPTASAAGTAALARTLHQTSSTTPEGSRPIPAAPSAAAMGEERLRRLEESFSRLLDSVGASAAFLVRIEALERKMTSLPETLGEMLARPHPVEAKLDSVRADMRAMDISVDSLSAQMKNCEAICHGLGADVRKLNTAMEGIAAELRHTQERSDNLDHDRLAVLKETQSELNTLQERITRVESGVVRAIHLLQSSEQGSAQVAHLRERFQEIEIGFQQVLQAVDSWQRAGESPEAAAERQATAKVLSSLSNLLQGLRNAQQEKQGLTAADKSAADKAIYQGALSA